MIKLKKLINEKKQLNEKKELDSKTIQAVAKMTQSNAHTHARMELAQALRDKKSPSYESSTLTPPKTIGKSILIPIVGSALIVTVKSG